MIEVNQGLVKWTITSTDGCGEFAFVGKIVVPPEEFDNVVIHFYKESKTYREAYDKTENLHESILGYRKYSDLESYRSNKSIRMKNKRNEGPHR